MYKALGRLLGEYGAKQATPEPENGSNNYSEGSLCSQLRLLCKHTHPGSCALSPGGREGSPSSQARLSPAPCCPEAHSLPSWSQPSAPSESPSPPPPPPEILIQQVWDGAQESACPTSSQVMLFLPAWGPHFENHLPKMGSQTSDARESPGPSFRRLKFSKSAMFWGK